MDRRGDIERTNGVKKKWDCLQESKWRGGWGTAVDKCRIGIQYCRRCGRWRERALGYQDVLTYVCMHMHTIYIKDQKWIGPFHWNVKD
jgi:hypothetical protein